MDESSLCKLFLLLAVAALSLSIISKVVLDDLADDGFRNFSLESMCAKINDSYMLVLQPNQTVCTKIMSLSAIALIGTEDGDIESLKEMCAVTYPDELSSEYAACNGLIDSYMVRIEECIDIQNGLEHVGDFASLDEVPDYCEAIISK